MKRSRFWFVLLIPVAIFLFGFITMSLWNSVLVAVLHVGAVTFWQALGILILCKILFGGFRGGGFGRHRRWGGEGFDKRREMFEKFQKMTPEERQHFKQNWRGRCAPWQRNETADAGAQENKSKEI